MQPENLDPAAAETVIDVRAVSKWFGNVVAVNDVSLQVRPGITGLLGPNGAGKTTLLRMIAGLAGPSEGNVTVFGEPVRGNPALYRRIGFMQEHETTYEFFTGRELVEFGARLSGLAETGAAADRTLDVVGLTDVQHRPISTYSRGMRQRARIAATLVHGPEVLLLDEPLTGTDPRQRIELQDLMRRLAGDGCTILISSHILEEVETLADNILLMVAGKLAAAGDYRAIRSKLDERPYEVRVVTNNPRSMAASLVGLEVVDSVSVDDTGDIVVLSRNIDRLLRSVPRVAKEQNIRLLRVEPLDESLESVFGYLVDG
jgi:ABC-2 type transport system ATP-binding protein